MAINGICRRQAVCVPRDCNVAEAAKLMRRHHAGHVVVVANAGSRFPIGMLTDRDIAISVVAPGLDPNAILIEDIMSEKLVSIREDAGVAEAIDLMRQHGIRQIPVVDGAGALVGIVADDDLIFLLAGEMSGLAAMVTTEHREEQLHRHPV